MANEYLKEGRITTEKLDCTVIALSYAFNIDYSVAHSICKRNGRKDGCRFSLKDVFDLKINESKVYKFKENDKRTVTFHGRPKMTVGKFRDLYKEGIFIVRVGGHIFTIINGVIFNNDNDKSIVADYYYITN